MHKRKTEQVLMFVNSSMRVFKVYENQKKKIEDRETQTCVDWTESKKTRGIREILVERIINNIRNSCGWKAEVVLTVNNLEGLLC